MFQMGGIGPMFGQLGFFHKFAGKDFEDKRPRDRYVAESRRLLAVLDGRCLRRFQRAGAGQPAPGPSGASRATGLRSSGRS
jgi:GST-like protein